MPLTLTASNGMALTAEPGEWIMGLVLLLDDAQKVRLMEIVSESRRLSHSAERVLPLPGGGQVRLLNGATLL
jgi:hypothetical protein